MNRFGSLRSVLLVLFKRKWVILSVLVSTVAVVTAGSMLARPVYRSSAKVALERESDLGKNVLFGYFAQRFEDYDWRKSEVEILRSHPVAEQVVRDLQLDALGPEEMAPRTDAERAAHFERAVQGFIAGLKVDNPPGSNIMEIAYEAHTPAAAAEVVNRTIETYRKRRSELYDESSTYRFFAAQLQEVEGQLRKLESEQADYQTREEIVANPKQVEILLDRLAGYEAKLTDVHTQRIGKEARLQAIDRQLAAGGEVTIPSSEVSDSPSQVQHIARLRGDLLDMETRRSQMLQRYRPNSPEVLELDAGIAEARQKVRAEVQQIALQERTAVGVIQAEEAELQRTIDSINAQIRQHSTKEYELSQLGRGIEDTREVYSMLLRQREDARISLAKVEKGVKSEVVSPAIPPTEPIRPRLSLNVALATALGLFAGLGLAVLLEAANHSMDTAEQVERMTGLVVLGSIRDRGEWRAELTA